MWFFYGEEEYLINSEINKVLTKLKGELIVFDEEASLVQIIEEINTFSLFDKRKIILVKNNLIFENTSREILKLVEGIKASQDSNEFIFVWKTSKITETPLFNYLKVSANSASFNKLGNNKIPRFIKNFVEEQGGKISNSAALKLADKLPSDLNIVSLEVKNLLFNSLNITDEIVETSASVYVRDDFFAFVNALVNGDNYMVILTLNDRLKLGEDPTSIFAQIGNTFSLALQVNALRNQGLSSDAISSNLKVHAFRIRRIIEMISVTNIDKIKKLNLCLGDLDFKVKTGQLNSKLALDNFVVNLLQ